MKILHINCSDLGSTGRIVQDICAEAHNRRWDSVSIFPRKQRETNPIIREYAVSLPFEQGIYRRIYYLYGLHYGFAPLSTRRILYLIQQEKPDIVHLHSINCATVNIYRLVSFLKRKKIATVITNHAEFFYTGSCPHAYDCEKWMSGCGNCPDLFAASESKLFDRTHVAWMKMKKAFQGHSNVSVVSVSPWVHERSKRSPILAAFPQRVILNGVNTDLFHHHDMYTAREQLGIEHSEKIILHVTANFSDLQTDNKGGRYILKLARRMRCENVRFLVIGRHADMRDLPDNITLVGEICDARMLAKYYCAADLCMIVSKRETFGMTVAEALCCGTPVVGFASGGSDSIALPMYTQFVPFGDVEGLELAVYKWIGYKRENNPTKISKIASDYYSARAMAGKYCDLYVQMGKRGQHT